jgi:Na+/pantothenate symporter
LLVTASTCQRDLVGVWREPRTEAAAVRATRGYVVLFAIVTTALALNPPGGIIALTTFSGSLYAACFFPAVLLGLYWRRGSGASVVASILVGLATLVAWKPLGLAPAVHEVFPAIVFSAVTYAVVALARPAAAGALFDRVCQSAGTAAGAPRPVRPSLT